MHVIGTDKVRFLALAKNGSTSLRSILKKNPKVIKGWYTTDKDANHKYRFNIKDFDKKGITFLFPLRNGVTRQRSGLLQDLHGKYKSVQEVNELKKILANLFRNKKYFHSSSYWNTSFFKMFMTKILTKKRWTGANIVFFDIEYLSSPQLMEFCTDLDPKWKGIKIPFENRSENTIFKRTILQLLKELAKNKESGVLDWFDKSSWQQDNIDRLLKLIRESEFFKDFYVKQLL